MLFVQSLLPRLALPLRLGRTLIQTLSSSLETMASELGTPSEAVSLLYLGCGSEATRNHNGL